MIWSLRKSVGFSHTSTPFDSVSTVTPISGISRRAATVPGASASSPSARVPATSSRHGVTVAAGAGAQRRRAARLRSPARGPAFSGAVASTTRLSSGNSSRASAATSAAVIVGRNRRTSVELALRCPGTASLAQVVAQQLGGEPAALRLVALVVRALVAAPASPLARDRARPRRSRAAGRARSPARAPLRPCVDAAVVARAPRPRTPRPSARACRRRPTRPGTAPPAARAISPSRALIIW